MSCPTDFIASVTTAYSPMPTGPTTLHWPAGSSPHPTQLRRAGRAITPKMVATTKTGMLALAAAGGGALPGRFHPRANPPSPPPQKPGPRYPLKPAVPSESGQVAQNLALNPHRPTLPQAHTPPAVSSFEAFRRPASGPPLAQ